MQKVLLICIACFWGIFVSAQSRKAMNLLVEARQEVAQNNYKEALDNLEKAIKDSPGFIEALTFAADIYRKLGEPEKSLSYYEQAMKYNPPYYVNLFYGETLFETGNYSKAKEAFERYAQSPEASPKYIAEVNHYLASCNFAIQSMASPKPYHPQNLGEKVNSRDMEYFPSISADGNTLVFTHRAPEGDRQDEDFYVTRRDTVAGEWTKAEPLRGFLNTELNEGAQALTSEGKIIYFAACERRDGYGSCDIYASFYQSNGVWSQPVNLGDSINSRIWESQPSISSDGRTLYFVRGGNSFAKNIDIYYAELRNDGRWGRAKKLRGAVNTERQETSPFIHFDNQSLYFSSNGHPGMGDLDFFVSRRQPNGSWGEPQNLGYPVNGPGQEFSLIVAPDGKTGYFSSDNLEGGHGLLDLYSFELPQESRAIEIAYIRGKVINKKTREPVSAGIEFNDINTGELVVTENSGRDGNYFSVLPGNADYALNIQKQGFLFYSKNFSLATQTPERAFILNVELVPIEVGEKVKLENVFFALDSYELEERSNTELNEVANFLRENPTVKVLLEGHTDSQGSSSYNQTLSQNRARSVYDYLIDKGIDPSRLSSKGYGDTQPVASNETPEGRQLNRRTELRITAY